MKKAKAIIGAEIILTVKEKLRRLVFVSREEQTFNIPTLDKGEKALI